MENKGYLKFYDEDVKNTFLSLDEKELKEFEDDLVKSIRKIYTQMKKDNLFEGTNVANARLGERFFRIEFEIDLTPGKEKFILLKEFKDISINEFLDNVDSDKKLDNEGYVKLI